MPLKRIARVLALSALAAVLAVPAFAAEGVSFTIAYHEKRIYYLGDAQNPIRLEAAIANNSDRPFRFKMSENPFYYNLDFEVSTPSNLLLEHSQNFIKSKHTNQLVFVRDVSLEPGERFVITLALEDYVKFEKPGQYTVKARFFPELNTPPGTAAPLLSNPLSLNLRPAVVFAEERASIEAQTGALEARQPLPPDEVVSYTLKARMSGQWEKFFLYLDLESLYQANPGRRESYRRKSEEDRRAALEEYKRQLRAERVDGDIAVIPTGGFTIEKTEYTPTEATVLVTERFKERDYTEVKRYTYTLQRRDRIWLLTGYEVVNLGTE